MPQLAESCSKAALLRSLPSTAPPSCWCHSMSVAHRDTALVVSDVHLAEKGTALSLQTSSAASPPGLLRAYANRDV